ncbi:hypothetical protein [Nostoc sp.]|uniref:hypothetical protein n=1 Tax=Nostoc sp. TaxID=1180 RepID=UPI002FF96F08
MVTNGVSHTTTLLVQRCLRWSLTCTEHLGFSTRRYANARWSRSRSSFAVPLRGSKLRAASRREVRAVTLVRASLL